MGCFIKRIVQLNEAIQYSEIKLFNDSNIDITAECYFSWSTDGVCWTGWSNLENYNRIASGTESDFYLRILIENTLSKISINGYFTTCYSICIDNSNLFLNDLCTDTIFSPYSNLDCALLLQQQLADSVICMLGIPIYYFKTEPIENTVDYTFKEFKLKNVTDVKQIKLMITDGELPSSASTLSGFDFDWDSDWVTQISKNHFATAFGDNAFPQNGDFIYIPMMKRMWNVVSATENKKDGLMWRPTTWDLALTKYQDSKNIITDKFDEVIDNWIVNKYDEVLGEPEKNEQVRESGVQQLDSPKFAATNLYNIFTEDAIRNQFTKDYIDIKETTICHKNNIICRNIYNFKNDNGFITYQKGICGESGSLSFIIDIPENCPYCDKNILTFGPIDIQFAKDKKSNKQYIGCHDLFQEIQPGTYMVIYRWDRSTFVTELFIYKHTYNKNLPKYLLRPETYYFDFENPHCKKMSAYNNDYVITTPQQCSIQSYPCSISNIKLYNRYLDESEIIKESIKYTTDHSCCVFNDLARPINSGHGYIVK